jgi:hypothetical protein
VVGVDGADDLVYLYHPVMHWLDRGDQIALLGLRVELGGRWPLLSTSLSFPSWSTPRRSTP